MKCSELLFALCKSDASEFHLHCYNHDGLMERMMKKFYVGFNLKSGKPKDDTCYLLLDCPLKDIEADVVFNHIHTKGELYEYLMFGYEVDDPCNEAIMTDVA